MTTTKRTRMAVLMAATAIFAGLPGQARADDFGKIVHSIENNYHVHRNYRWVMGFAGIVVRISGGFSGVKAFKAALFEDQHFAFNPDSNLDEVVQSAGDHGWQPMVKSFSRHGHEHTYIYAREEGKDLKLLIVNVEPTEAIVIQVKINPNKLAKFIDKTEGGGHYDRDHGDGMERMAFR